MDYTNNSALAGKEEEHDLSDNDQRNGRSGRSICWRGNLRNIGDNAPDTLKDFCYSVEVTPVQGEIKPGNKLVIDGQEYKITMVGDVARENLNNLGHVTYSFNGSGECLPGSICVEKTDVPTLKVGSTISITE